MDIIIGLYLLGGWLTVIFVGVPRLREIILFCTEEDITYLQTISAIAVGFLVLFLLWPYSLYKKGVKWLKQ